MVGGYEREKIEFPCGAKIVLAFRSGTNHKLHPIRRFAPGVSPSPPPFLRGTSDEFLRGRSCLAKTLQHEGMEFHTLDSIGGRAGLPDVQEDREEDEGDGC